jgi:hypothetical protein
MKTQTESVPRKTPPKKIGMLYTRINGAPKKIGMLYTRINGVCRVSIDPSFNSGTHK